MASIQLRGVDRVLARMKQARTKAVSRMRAIDGHSVSVEIPADAKYGNGTSVSAVANFVEYGTASMPPRPYMRTAKAMNAGKWRAMLRRRMVQVFAGKTSAEAALTEVGERIKQDIQASIQTEGAVDTGTLKNSYKVIVK